jgi:predicted metal-dependent HD superfamily phosphohydrolase
MFTSDRLDGALALLGLDPAPEIFRQLQRMYCEPGRYYHTDQHVAECLKALDQHAHLADKSVEVELAIWFHDAVYDSRRSDNEEQCAALARRQLSSVGADAGSIDRVESMILATKSHQANGRDVELLLDIDLGILGQPPAVFNSYDAAIRKEYAWVPEEQYLAGRAAVLQSFLDRPRIYCTRTFRDAYEEQARRNLESRIQKMAHRV